MDPRRLASTTALPQTCIISYKSAAFPELQRRHLCEERQNFRAPTSSGWSWETQQGCAHTGVEKAAALEGLVPAGHWAPLLYKLCVTQTEPLA